MLPWLAWPEDFSSLGDAGIHLEILGQQQTCQYFFSILHLICYDQKPTSSSLQHILTSRLMRAHKSHFVTFILQLKDQIFLLYPVATGVTSGANAITVIPV